MRCYAVDILKNAKQARAGVAEAMSEFHIRASQTQDLARDGSPFSALNGRSGIASGLTVSALFGAEEGFHARRVR